MLLSDLPPELPLLLLATADVPLADLDADALKLFGSGGQPSSQPNSCLLILLNKICNMHPCKSCFLLSPVASLDAQSVDSRPSCEACLCRAESVYSVSSSALSHCSFSDP